MYFKPILTLGFIFCAAQPLYAQNVVVPDKYTELLTRNVCTDADASAALEKCSEWVAIATCAMAYDDQVANVEKFFSDEQMQKFRIQGEKQIPPTCEPMARINLSMVILEKDLKLKNPILSANDRLSRWKNIVKQAMPKSKGASLDEAQYELIIERLMDAPDFDALKKDKDVQAFIRVVMDSYAKKMTNLKSATQSNKKQIDILRQIESSMPNLITPDVSLILLADEIQRGQYSTAQERMDTLDFSKLSTSQKDTILPFIEDASVRIWGNAKFQSSRCLKEDIKQAPSHPLNYLTQNPNHPSVTNLMRAQIDLWLKTCEYDKIANQLVTVWNIQYKNDGMVKLMDEVIAWMETDADPSLTLTFIKRLDSLDKAAANAWMSKYGKRMIKFALPMARYDFENDRIDKAVSWIKPLISLAPQTEKCELQLLYGRCLEKQKNGVSARQQWAQIIDNSPNTACGRTAIELSILSFRKAKMNAEADELESRIKGR